MLVDSAVQHPIPLVGYLLYDPLHNRIEPLLVKRMSAVDAEFGDEVAADLGYNFVCIPRVLVPGARYDQGRSRSNG